MARLFISYSHRDRPVAERLADALRKSGHDVWWDEKLLAGHTFSDKIRDALDNADRVIVLWTRQGVDSHWVRDEASHAKASGKLLPIKMDDVELPLGFGQLHTLDLQRWDGSLVSLDFLKVLQAIAEGLSAPVRPPGRDKAAIATIIPVLWLGAAAAALSAAFSTWLRHPDAVEVLPAFAELVGISIAIAAPGVLCAWLAARWIGVAVTRMAVRLYVRSLLLGGLAGIVLVAVGSAGRAHADPSAMADAFFLGALVITDFAAAIRLAALAIRRR